MKINPVYKVSLVCQELGGTKRIWNKLMLKTHQKVIAIHDAGAAVWPGAGFLLASCARAGSSNPGQKSLTPGGATGLRNAGLEVVRISGSGRVTK